MDKFEPAIRRILQQNGFTVAANLESASGYFYEQNSDEYLKLVAQIDSEEYKGCKILSIYVEEETGEFQKDFSCSLDQFLVWKDNSLEPVPAKFRVHKVITMDVEIDCKTTQRLIREREMTSEVEEGDYASAAELVVRDLVYDFMEQSREIFKATEGIEITWNPATEFTEVEEVTEA